MGPTTIFEPARDDHSTEECLQVQSGIIAHGLIALQGAIVLFPVGQSGVYPTQFGSLGHTTYNSTR
jgi:hypothetical protein